MGPSFPGSKFDPPHCRHFPAVPFFVVNVLMGLTALRTWTFYWVSQVGMFAGTLETPGETVQKPVVIPESHKTVKVPFKVFRGMASLEAIVDRLDVEDAESADVEALGAEGMEIAVPLRGSVRPVVRNLLKHLCSAISYGGARSLGELQAMFRADPGRYVIRLSESGRRESFDR